MKKSLLIENRASVPHPISSEPNPLSNNEQHQYLITFEEKTHVFNNLPKLAYSCQILTKQTFSNLYMRLSLKLNIPKTYLKISLVETTKYITYLKCKLLIKGFILGGKGGFGTLLKGQSKKAPDKFSVNFNACRDLNGRRLRFVNDELKLRALQSNSSDSAQGGIEGWYMDIPNWSGISNKAIRRKELKRKRELEYIREQQEEKDRIEKENKRKREQQIEDYVKSSEVQGLEGIDLQNAILLGMKRKSHESKKEIQQHEAEKKLDDAEDNEKESDKSQEISEAKEFEFLGSLSGEIIQFQTSETQVTIKSASSFATACILLPHFPQVNCYYYQLTLPSKGIMQIGWTSASFSPKNQDEDGIGDDEYSYSYDPFRSKIFHNGIEFEYGSNADVEECEEGAILGCYYDSKEKKIGYYLNNIHLGVAFENVNKKNETLFPAFSLNFDETIYLNLVIDKTKIPQNFISVFDFGKISNANKVTKKEVVKTNKEIEEKKIPVMIDLNLYNSAKELEVLGLEDLKYHLQSRGCKCGGTLQERAKRLFRVKGLKYEEYPEKVRAK